jgi:hypothetical protein
MTRNEQPVAAGQQRFLGTKEVAHLLGVSVRTVEDWRYKGIGPWYCFDRGRAYYRVCDLEAFLASQCTSSVKSMDATRPPHSLSEQPQKPRNLKIAESNTLSESGDHAGLH